jgi:hypothetical protein
MFATDFERGFKSVAPRLNALEVAVECVISVW